MENKPKISGIYDDEDIPEVDLPRDVRYIPPSESSYDGKTVPDVEED